VLQLVRDYKEILDLVQSSFNFIVIGYFFWLRWNTKRIKLLSIKSDKKDASMIEHTDEKIKEIREELERAITKMEVLTENGVSDGLNSRKEIWIEIRKIGNDVSKLEGYLLQNGYKKGD